MACMRNAHPPSLRPPRTRFSLNALSRAASAVNPRDSLPRRPLGIGAMPPDGLPRPSRLTRWRSFARGVLGQQSVNQPSGALAVAHVDARTRVKNLDSHNVAQRVIIYDDSIVHVFAARHVYLFEVNVEGVFVPAVFELHANRLPFSQPCRISGGGLGSQDFCGFPLSREPAGRRRAPFAPTASPQPSSLRPRPLRRR